MPGGYALKILRNHVSIIENHASCFGNAHSFMAMTKTEMRRNNTNLRLVLILLSVLAISCTAIREFGDRPSEKVQKLNESVPAGVGTAEKDHRIHDLDSFKIVLPEPGQILLGDADAEPTEDRKSTRLNSSHGYISYAVC